MEKKSVQAISIVAFFLVLYVGAVTGASIQSGEIGQIQDAMRALKRVDNLQFSYQSRISDLESESIQGIDTWVDMLSGSWISEHSNTDEDGTLLYLREYFDGDTYFEYITTHGVWYRNDAGSSEVMNLGVLTSLPYEKEDITNINVTNQDGMQTISFSPTQAYMERMKQELLEESRSAYHSYEKLQIQEEAVEAARIGIEQYENSDQGQIIISYTIDSGGVLRGMNYCGTFSQQDIVTDEEGSFRLGEENSLQYEISVEVKAYNDEMVLNKLETYALDVRGVE